MRQLLRQRRIPRWRPSRVWPSASSPRLPASTTKRREACNTWSRTRSREDARSSIPVLDFDQQSGATRTTSADRLLRHIEGQGLTLEWILDTHPHADHFSAAGYLKDVTGASTAIGERVVEVQRIWKKLYNLPDTFRTDGSQWDHLFADGERFAIGEMAAGIMLSPGLR